MTVAVLLGLSLGAVSAQVTTQMEWQRCIGGSGFDDPGPGFTRTDDGGFVVVGWSDSNDGDVTGDHGSLDILVTKLDANGSAQWNRALGGSEAEFGVSCIEASDGSLYVMGNTGSVDGDVTGTLGLQGIWVVKLSAKAPFFGSAPMEAPVVRTRYRNSGELPMAGSCFTA
jgi:hypothetical protein